MTDLSTLIGMVQERHGKLPTVDWVSRTAKVSLEEAQTALDAYTVQQGQFQTATEAPTTPPEAEPVKVPEAKAESPHTIPVGALRVVAGVLALIAIVRAFFYSVQWFVSDDDLLLSWLMSALVVGVTVLMPQMGFALWKRSSRGLAVVAWCLASVVMVFSMLMTIGGIYNDRSAKAVKAAQETQDNLRAKGIWQDLLNRESALQQAIDSTFKEQARLQKALDKLDPADPAYNTTQRRLDQQTHRLDSLRGDLLNLQMEKAKTGAVVEPRQDFFDWLGTVLGVPRDWVEFGAAVIPAVVIDIAAPVLLFVVFFV